MSYFYLGPNGNSGPAYGLINVGLFLAQAAIESAYFGACDEVSCDKEVIRSAKQDDIYGASDIVLPCSGS